jgi:hypothetical protein
VDHGYYPEKADHAFHPEKVDHPSHPEKMDHLYHREELPPAYHREVALLVHQMVRLDLWWVLSCDHVPRGTVQHHHQSLDGPSCHRDREVRQNLFLSPQAVDHP